MVQLAPPTPRPSVCYDSWIRRLDFAHYGAYTIASTGYAASYLAPTGALLMGQEKTPLGQRVSEARKSIGEEILNHCSSFSAMYYTITLGPLVGASTPMYAPPLVYIRGALARRADTPRRVKAEDRLLLPRAILLPVDVGYYTPAARTTLDRGVLEFSPQS